jgi:hypothetical protein
MCRKKPDPKLSTLPNQLYPLPSLSFVCKESPVINRWIGPVLVTIVFLILTLWTWRKWPDVLIDFGRELYIPWQINTGKVLYKDIAYRHGPLAPYVNALWFHIFGVSLTTLIYCNLAIIFTLISIIFSQIKISCDRTTAVMACIVYLSTAAFAQYMYMGSFNFVCPYDHSVTHAILFSFLMIYCLSSYSSSHRYVMLVFAGLFCGLVFLTKAEIFAPLAVTAFVGMMLINYESKSTGQNWYKNFSIFIVSMAIPIALFLIYFSLRMPFSQALGGVLGDWAFMYNTEISNIYFFKKSMGTDRLIYNIALIIISSGVLSIVVWAWLLLDRADLNNYSTHYLCYSVFLIIIILPLMLNFNNRAGLMSILFNIVYRPLAIVNIITLIIILYLIYLKKEYIIINKMAPFIMLNVFGLLALTKIILACRVEQYGFTLAMTAMIIDVALFVWLIPTILRKEYGRGKLFRKLAILGFSLVSIYALIISNDYYSRKQYAIGEGADTFLSYGPAYESEGWAVNRVIKYIKESISPHDNFTPIPEGLMINYLMRRPSPFKLDGITPGELTSYGESAILNSLSNAHPNYILLIHRRSEEFGVGYFGLDIRNGKLIMDWIKNNYSCVWQLLDEPLKDGKFGMRMLKRNE